MLRANKFFLFIAAFSLSSFIVSCDKDEDNTDSFDTSGTYTQNDQMARPAINTVFVGASRKNEFNTTIPSAMNTAFKTDFVNKLTAFGYTSNALGQNKDQLANLLVTDVLNVKTSGTTTFFDGTNVLTGRALGDDVIDTELLLIFGEGVALFTSVRFSGNAFFLPVHFHSFPGITMFFRAGFLPL